jgi:hypothetical protein
MTQGALVNCTDDLVFLGARRLGAIATSTDPYRAECQSEQSVRLAGTCPNSRTAKKRDRLLLRESSKSAPPAKEKTHDGAIPLTLESGLPKCNNVQLNALISRSKVYSEKLGAR